MIGVVRNVGTATNVERLSSIYQSYRLLARDPGRSIALSLRSSVAPTGLVQAVRRALTEIDPELPLLNLRPAEQTIALNLGNFALGGAMLSGFALLGLLLAALGLYGVICGYVVQRTSEIGIRMALGAQTRDILHLVLGQGLRLMFVGAAIGIAGSVASQRLLGAVIPAFPTDGLFVEARMSVLLMDVGLIACWLSARRAAKVHPIVALRAE